MSHFKVAIITEDDKQETLEKALQPYHEFECTGIIDEYVQSIDITEEIKTDYENYKEKESIPFELFLEAELNYPFLKPGEEPDIYDEKYKWGWIELDEKSEVSKVIDRTNPNKKWDWWEIGGRYSNRLLLNTGHLCDSAPIKDIDFEKKKQCIIVEQGELWDKFMIRYEKYANKFIPWEKIDKTQGIEKARTEYWNQEGLSIFQKDKDFDWLDFNDFLVSKEEYCESRANLSVVPFALVADGNWHEKGNMGWFAWVSNEKKDWVAIYNNLMSEVDPNNYYTIVDCHI